MCWGSELDLSRLPLIVWGSRCRYVAARPLSATYVCELRIDDPAAAVGQGHGLLLSKRLGDPMGDRISNGAPRRLIWGVGLTNRSPVNLLLRDDTKNRFDHNHGEPI